jgi:hypothetical protein
MEPLLYDTLKKKMQALSDDAVRIRLGPEITRQRMKNYMLRLAHELDVPVTVRRVPGGVIFWRSSDEDRHQAQEVAGRLRGGRRKRTTRPKARQRTATRPGVHEWCQCRACIHNTVVYAQLTSRRRDEEARNVFASQYVV